MRIHAIIIALNEEDFIQETIRPLYNNCTGISIITQYDRDYYGKKIVPDSTVQKILDFPDPEGKIHLVARKFNDETASRNHEMNAILFDASKEIQTHGVDKRLIAAFHQPPDYFLICDADEIYDEATLPDIIKYLKEKRPRGMRISGYDYFFDWNHRLPRDKYVHHQFGFVKAGLFFEQRRVLSWNESRINVFFSKFRLLRNLGSKLFGFIDCPVDTGMFHHGGYVRRNRKEMLAKLAKHSHLEVNEPGYLDRALNQEFEFVEINELYSAGYMAA
jgi:glycosyltransferase involved in cell wall biosynthesis